jgi:hypothetical protein
VLTGTMIIDGKATAFLRENAGGKSRRVAQGEQINGMLVAEVKPDRVKLTLGDEAEDLVLGRHRPEDNDAAGRRTAPGTCRRGAAPCPPERPRRSARRAPSRATGAEAAAAAPPADRQCSTPRGAYAPPTAGRAGGRATDPRWAETEARIRARVRAAQGAGQSK